MENPEQDTTAEESDEAVTAPEFDPDEIENDPARNPDDEGLQGLKGG